MQDVSHEVLMSDGMKIDSALRTVIADKDFIAKESQLETVRDLVLIDNEAGQIELNRNGLVVIRPKGSLNDAMVFQLL